MWALRPSYFDNDTPIDLRKKVVLQRDLEEQKLSYRPERVVSPKEEEERERWHQQALLPLGKLYPFMSERYGVRCALISSAEYHERPPEPRPGSRGSLEETIRKLHYNNRFKVNEDYTKERCRSLDSFFDPKQSNQDDHKLNRLRWSSCPELRQNKSKPAHKKQPSGYLSDSGGESDSRPVDASRNRSPANLSHPHLSERLSRAHVPVRIVGGAKKRKSFIPFNGDRVPSPKKHLPQSPIEYHSYDEYYTYQEMVLRRQLQQQSTSPYLLQVYDYYQQLVQRFRDHTSTQIRRAPPQASPTPPPEDDGPLDAQRKRPCRALTGKHVKQGTGASLSTLLTLRQKIQERQKAREQQPRETVNGTNGKNATPRKNSSKKAKPTSKSLVSKVQN